MKKWLKLHKKQIFAILCVFMLSLSCITFVSADDEQEFYNFAAVTDITICGIPYSDFKSAPMPAFVYNADAIIINHYSYDGLTFEFEYNSYLDESSFYFYVSVDSSFGDSNGTSSITFNDFYVTFDSFDSVAIDIDTENYNGVLLDGTEVIINYSPVGSDLVISNVTYPNLENGEIIFSDAFGDIDSDVYVHSIIVNFPVSNLTDNSLFGVGVYTDTSFDGRSADIGAAESNNGGSVLTSLFDSFAFVINWLVNSLGILVSLFFVNGKFTVIGILSIIATSISFALLLIFIIVRFVRFRS